MTDVDCVLKMFERGLAQRSQDPHMWYQFGLLFASLQQPEHSLIAFKEYMNLAGSSPTSLLMSAKMCIILQRVRAVITLASRALQ